MSGPPTVKSEQGRVDASPSGRGAFDSPRWWLLPAPLLAVALLTTAWLIRDRPVEDSVTEVARVPAGAGATVLPGPSTSPLASERHYPVASADPGYGLYRDEAGAYLGGWRVGSRAVWAGAPEPARYAVFAEYHYVPGLGEKPARLRVRVGDRQLASYLTVSEEGAAPRRAKLGEIEVTSSGESVESELIEGPGEASRLKIGPITFIPLITPR